MVTFEFEQALDRKYYEEVVCIANSCEKFIKNPKRKAKSPFFDFAWIFPLMIIAMVLSFMLLSSPNLVVYKAVITTIYVVFITLYGLLAIRYCRAISKMQKMHSKRSFFMDDTKLSLKGDGKETTMEVSQVSAVVINKNSVCFLPKDKNGVLFGLPRYCKDEIVPFMESIGKGNLIVVNN